VTAKLSKRFYDVLGEDVANELVDWFNAVDLTYRTELRELNELNFQQTQDPETRTRTSQYEMAFRMQASVPELTDLKSEPESTWQNPSRSATILAVDDLPEAAGPSIATTR